eukprot:Lithocolla_globosa_v1_NODE_53_length_7694_cov_9.633984.p5 type:complete len:126 gc:universal NODE_53_length_7694_cov_9.633984:3431-3808(+)
MNPTIPTRMKRMDSLTLFILGRHIICPFHNWFLKLLSGVRYPIRISHGKTKCAPFAKILFFLLRKGVIVPVVILRKTRASHPRLLKVSSFCLIPLLITLQTRTLPSLQETSQTIGMSNTDDSLSL